MLKTPSYKARCLPVINEIIFVTNNFINTSSVKLESIKRIHINYYLVKSLVRDCLAKKS